MIVFGQFVTSSATIGLAMFQLTLVSLIRLYEFLYNFLFY
jgi:hypothetical protein